MKKGNVLRGLQLLITVVMLIQVLYGIGWMAVNLTSIPVFGDSTEYFNLSQSLQVDEYRPILYPLVIRLATEFCGIFSIPYQTVLYIMQTAVSFFSILYLVFQIRTVILKMRNKRLKKLFSAKNIMISLYLLCIPMITFMNFSVLTDSLATSMLVFATGAVIKIFHEETPEFSGYIVVFLSMLIEYTLRADRLYTCTVFLVICFGVYLLRKRRTVLRTVLWRKAAVLAVATVLGSTAIAGAVNRMTQQPGLYERIPTTLGFVLLDRVVWPNMEANYQYFSEEIQKLISLEDARTFDQHNNNVMYQMAPLLREKAGEKKAEEIYLEMAGVVFERQPVKVCTDILEDIACSFFTPVSAFLSTRGLAETADDWNLHCVSQKSPALSRIYYMIYLYTYMLLFLCCCIIIFNEYFVCIRKKHGKKRIRQVVKVRKLLWPGFLLCFIISLWFSIGDGAPPNDRYALLHYIIWTLWGMLHLNRIFEDGMREGV